MRERCNPGPILRAGSQAMCLDVCLCVCGHKNEHFDRSRPAYELYFLCMSQKSKNISFYIPHERERTSVSQLGKADVSIFFALLKLLFNIVDPCQKNDYYQSGRS